MTRRRLRTAIFALGVAVGLFVGLSTCARGCYAEPITTFAGFRAAMERLP